MLRRCFRFLAARTSSFLAFITLATFLASSIVPSWAINSVRGGALPLPLPLFPADNWWNLDISSWPVDANSTNYVAFINNGGTRRLHPDFGGNAGSGFSIYGMPYAVVTNVSNGDLNAVQFQYSSESDGVDHAAIRLFEQDIFTARRESKAELGFVIDKEAAGLDHRVSRHKKLVRGRIIGEKAAADVHGRIAVIIEFDEIELRRIGVRQEFIDQHSLESAQ